MNTHTPYSTLTLSAGEKADIGVIRTLKHLTTVLLILFRLDRPLTISQVAELAQINLETARVHLRKLAQLRYVTRTSGRQWILTTAGRQLILPTAENPRLSSTTTITTRLEESRVVEGEVEESSARNRGKSAVCTANRGFSAIRPEILNAFERAGIGLNRRTIQLAAQPHITPEYIDAHHKRLVEQGKGLETGLLIVILESAQDIPHPPADNRIQNRSRYAEWERR